MRPAALVPRARDRWRADPVLQDRGSAVGVWTVGAVAVGLDLAVGGLGLPHPVDGSRWLHLVPLTAGALVMLGKRRRPVAALGAGVVLVAADVGLLGGSLGTMLVLLDLLFAAASWASAVARRRLEVAVAVVCVGCTASAGGLTGDVRVAAAVAIQLVAVLVVPLWWASNVRHKSELVELERELASRRLRVARLDADRALQAERAAMARDLHDLVASHLSAVTLHSAAALAGEADAGRDRGALEQVRRSSLAALVDMRAMIDLLRSGESADEPPGSDGLDRAAELVAAARAAGLSVRYDETGCAPAAPAGPGRPATADVAAYRILGEALTNAVKHAPGSAVSVLVHRGDPVRLRVENRCAAGPAATWPLSAGDGLRTMRERATAVGGQLRAGPRHPDRWVVEAVLPAAAGPGGGP